MFSVVIVNYDGAGYLPECLAAVRRQTYAGDIEIIAVNNRSTDGSLEFLRAQDDVRLVEPGKNLGFSGGQNLGIRAGGGEYVLALNFDCLLEPEFLERVAEVFAAHPRVGSVSGRLRKIINGRKSRLLDSAGISFHRCLPAHRGEWEPDGPAWDTPGAIFGPSGAAACYRREALESVRFEDEYFDEDFFLYYEDIDLAWRLRLAGWQSRYEPRAVAYHERGSTRKQSPWERRNYLVAGFRNRLLAMYKNLRWREDVRPHWPRLLWQEICFALGAPNNGLRPDFTRMVAIQRALAMILRAGRLRRKRRFVQERLGHAEFTLGFDRPQRDVHMPRGTISARNLGKCFRLYRRPVDRLKQALLGGHRRYYQEHWSLRNVSFEIARGEAVGIVGRDGAGKSTLLRIIAGILTPTEGEVRRAGKVFALSELGAGFDPDSTGRENLLTSGALFGMARAEVDSILPAVIAFAEIGECLDQPVKTYSSGVSARLALALALHVRADVLLIDEILSAGDVFFQAKCFRRLDVLLAQGVTVLLCSHDLVAVRKVCSRALYLAEGALAADGPVEEVLGQYLRAGPSPAFSVWGGAAGDTGRGLSQFSSQRKWDCPLAKYGSYSLPNP